MNLQPVQTVKCIFANDGPGATKKTVTVPAIIQKQSGYQLTDFGGVENDTETIFCRSPPWVEATVRVHLELDGVLAVNHLTFSYYRSKMTRIAPRRLAVHSESMIFIYGHEFQNVAKPRCRFRSKRNFNGRVQNTRIVEATYHSRNLVTCRAPSRVALPPTKLQKNNWLDPHVESTSPWYEQVDVNTKTWDSFCLKTDGLKNHASLAYHRSHLLYEDVTIESWVNWDKIIDGAALLWFGLVDPKLQARFMYGVFFRKRSMNVTREEVMNMTSGMKSNVTRLEDVADIEIGHTANRPGYTGWYAGKYNLTWPLQDSPANLTKTFHVGLMQNCFHHLAAVRSFVDRTWTLYVNGSFIGSFSYGNVTNVTAPAMGVRYNATRYKERLYSFFTEYDPKQYWKVENYLAEYKGREQELFTYLYNLYPAAAATLNDANGNPLKDVHGNTAKGIYPDNLLRQDATEESGTWSDQLNTQILHDDPDHKGQAHLRGMDINAGGTDPRTRTSPFACDPRIHGVDVCILPWGATAHRTVPTITVAKGAWKYQIHSGKIDELRLWRTARTQAEIQANMDIELAGNELGLAAYYNFNEGEGVMAYDSSVTTTSPDENQNNLHLLGNPATMWQYSNMIPSFTDSATYCPHCSILYTPVPQTQAPDFRYEPETMPFGIEPSIGPILGGTIITIRGRGFVNSDLLWSRWQGIAPLQGGQGQGTGFIKPEFISSKEVRLISPPHARLGLTDIFFTNDGENFNLDPVQFKYSDILPVIHSISVEPGPLVGHPGSYCAVRTPLTGGTTITIHGENFLQMDNSKMGYFRMGEMPMIPIHKRIDDNTILIKTPSLHTRFWGDPQFNNPDGSSNVFPDAFVMPRPYGRADPYSYGGDEALSKAIYGMDDRYDPWGSGMPFDCSRDAPGSRCYRPVFTLRLTLDEGRHWSYLPQYTTMYHNNSENTWGVLTNRSNCVFYSDLIVSPDGDDDLGEGTYTRPFKSLLKAAEWAHGENDRIHLFAATRPTSELQQLMMLPKKLTIIQDPPLRTDQSAGVGGRGRRLCKCKDAAGTSGNPLPGKTLCECEHETSQSYFQDSQADSGASDYDEMARSTRDYTAGTANMGAYFVANGGHDHQLIENDRGLTGGVQVDLPDSIAHGDYMGAVDSDSDPSSEGMSSGFQGQA